MCQLAPPSAVLSAWLGSAQPARSLDRQEQPFPRIDGVGGQVIGGLDVVDRLAGIGLWVMRHGDSPQALTGPNRDPLPSSPLASEDATRRESGHQGPDHQEAHDQPALALPGPRMAGGSLPWVTRS